MTAALWLALGAAVCWGISSFLGGLQSRRLPALTVALWSQFPGAIGLAAVLLASRQAPAGASIAWGVGAGLVGGIAAVLFYRGLAVGLLSIVVPVSACAAVVPVVFAIARGDVPSTLAIAGIAAVMLGIVLVSLRPGPTPDGASNARAALTFALGAALGFGMFFVLLDRGSAVPGASPWWAVAGARASLIATLLAMRAARPGLARWPGRRMGAVAAIGLVDTAGMILFAYASTQGNLGVVSTVGSLYPILTVLLGRIVLAERPTTTQNAGVACALAGVTLLAAA